MTTPASSSPAAQPPDGPAQPGPAQPGAAPGRRGWGAVSIVLVLSSSPRVRILRESGQLEQAFRVYFQAIFWLAGATVLSFVSLLLDTDRSLGGIRRTLARGLQAFNRREGVCTGLRMGVRLPSRDARRVTRWATVVVPVAKSAH